LAISTNIDLDRWAIVWRVKGSDIIVLAMIPFLKSELYGGTSSWYTMHPAHLLSWRQVLWINCPREYLSPSLFYCTYSYTTLDSNSEWYMLRACRIRNKCKEKSWTFLFCFQHQNYVKRTHIYIKKKVKLSPCLTN
jgi:hypothetical protein